MAQTENKTSVADKARLTTRVRMGKDVYGPGDEWLFASRSDVTDAMLENLQGRKIATGDWDALRAKIASGEAAPAVQNPLTDAEKDSTIAELEQDLETAQSAYDAVKAERDEARSVVEVAKEAATHLHDALEERTSERDAALADVETLNGKLAEVTAERDKLKGDLNQIITGERTDTPAEDGETGSATEGSESTATTPATDGAPVAPAKPKAK